MTEEEHGLYRLLLMSGREAEASAYLEMCHKAEQKEAVANAGSEEHV